MTFGTEPPPSSGDEEHGEHEQHDEHASETRSISSPEPGPTPGYGAPPPPPPAGAAVMPPAAMPPTRMPPATPPAPGYGPSSPGSYAAPSGPTSGPGGGPGGPPTIGQSFGSLSAPTSDQAKGFFAKLFDFSFRTFVTPSVVKILYILSIVLVVLGWLGYSIAAFQSSAAAGLLVLIIIGPLVALFWLILLRVTLELYVAVIRIAEDMRILSQK